MRHDNGMDWLSIGVIAFAIAVLIAFAVSVFYVIVIAPPS
jgi:hypothetical protein